MKLSFEKIRSSKLNKKDYLKIPIMAGIITIPPVIMTYWTMPRRKCNEFTVNHRREEHRRE